MLSHTSGIYDYTRDSLWDTESVELPISDKRLFSLFENKPLNFMPGTKFSYSNTNYKLLGMIIEKVTGKTYYVNVRERIFQPLGMTHSGFDFTHLKDEDKTVGYFRVRNDSFLVAPIVDSTHTNAAGGIYSTTADMLKWHEALQSHKLLDAEWQNKAYVPVKNHYGYGWEIDTIAGKRVLSHSGHIHGYNSNFYHMPEENVCVVIFTNFMKTGADPIMYAYDIVRALYDPSYTIPGIRKEVQVSDAVKKRYEGIYTFVEDSSLQFTFTCKNKHLYTQLTGQPEIMLLPQSETMFFTKVVDAQVEFKKNDKGEYEMVLYQGGQELKAKKNK
jgi:CubicO group peptidase (beta-lactamase class C family)